MGSKDTQQKNSNKCSTDAQSATENASKQHCYNRSRIMQEQELKVQQGKQKESNRNTAAEKYNKQIK